MPVPRQFPPATTSIATRIVAVRGAKVILDSDLAALYGVETRRLNEQVRRNLERFPADFMFRLQGSEWESLRSQTATLDSGRGKHRKYPPHVFTEHGALMAASVLNTPRAVEVSVYVVRAFVQLRSLLSTHKELADKLSELERRLGTHDLAIAGILATIRQMMTSPDGNKAPIGFVRPK